MSQGTAARHGSREAERWRAPVPPIRMPQPKEKTMTDLPKSYLPAEEREGLTTQNEIYLAYGIGGSGAT
jgi:hypothetical protein